MRAESASDAGTMTERRASSSAITDAALAEAAAAVAAAGARAAAAAAACTLARCRPTVKLLPPQQQQQQQQRRQQRQQQQRRRRRRQQQRRRRSHTKTTRRVSHLVFTVAAQRGRIVGCGCDRRATPTIPPRGAAHRPPPPHSSSARSSNVVDVFFKVRSLPIVGPNVLPTAEACRGRGGGRRDVEPPRVGRRLVSLGEISHGRRRRRPRTRPPANRVRVPSAGRSGPLEGASASAWLPTGDGAR